MAHLQRRKLISVIFTAVIGLGFLVYVQWQPSQRLTENAPGPVDQSPVEGDAAEVQGAQEDQPARLKTIFRSRSRPVEETVAYENLSLARVTISHDVPLEDYKAELWNAIQADPPEIRQAGDSSIDAEAAYSLYMYFGNCSVMPRTDQQVDERLEHIENRVQSARAGNLPGLEGQANQLIDNYELCSFIPPDVDSRMEAVMWMTEAVILGHEVAEIQFYNKAMGFILRPDRYFNRPPLAMLHPELVDEFKYTARMGLDHALERGHPEVYLAKSQAFLEGLIYPRDPVQAFAYAIKAEMEAAGNRTIAANVGYWKRAAAQYLDPEQLAEARHLALEMHSDLDD